jgi:hypothetical protein
MASQENVHLDDPAHWRKRASEMRALAADTRDAESKQIILKLAADFEDLAAHAEARISGRRAQIRTT